MMDVRADAFQGRTPFLRAWWSAVFPYHGAYGDLYAQTQLSGRVLGDQSSPSPKVGGGLPGPRPHVYTPQKVPHTFSIV